MKKTLITILSATLLFSRGGANKETTEVTLEAETEELSNLEKEHLLEKVAYADSVNVGLIEDTFKGSARREAIGSIGDATVTINYGSPGKRGRVIWNGLVSYDQVWVSGSHWATAVTFSEDVVINEVEVPAGMYGFFTIPGREEWTLIINKHYDQHLADEYDEADDLVRVSVKPIDLDNEVQRLTYEVDKVSDTEGAISLSWDQVKVSMPFSIK
ncbi:Protein of unknown function (DUF2911) [Belliella baltica DSM 15883]|uniref:DUF2911 domain-containing protein n=1 Tax=Belliella baltica (strain DSM 15883 / CIP 108006 / LMG 21964 / BA134) TaxID=866536 RepID=I3Z1E8_BELBD|nr:DUF2911 domain-containing protein [Belliella baltica]AFL83066.1 Protein of unknown function (DUF2911) [Belliella baltica DSM 15883]